MYVTVLAREIPRSRPPNVTGLSSSPNFYTPRVLGGDLLLLSIVNACTGELNQTRRPFCTGLCDYGIPTVAELVDATTERKHNAGVVQNVQFIFTDSERSTQNSNFLNILIKIQH